MHRSERDFLLSPTWKRGEGGVAERERCLSYSHRLRGQKKRVGDRKPRWALIKRERAPFSPPLPLPSRYIGNFARSFRLRSAEKKKVNFSAAISVPFSHPSCRLPPPPDFTSTAPVAVVVVAAGLCGDDVLVRFPPGRAAGGRGRGGLGDPPAGRVVAVELGGDVVDRREAAVACNTDSQMIKRRFLAFPSLYLVRRRTAHLSSLAP